MNVIVRNCLGPESLHLDPENALTEYSVDGELLYQMAENFRALSSCPAY